MQPDSHNNNNNNNANLSVSNLSSSTYHVLDIADESPHPPSRIPLEKWQEILEEERDSHVIGWIREEIVRSAVDAIYDGHLRKAVYGFIVNRVRDDWTRMFQVICKNFKRI